MAADVEIEALPSDNVNEDLRSCRKGEGGSPYQERMWKPLLSDFDRMCLSSGRCKFRTMGCNLQLVCDRTRPGRRRWLYAFRAFGNIVSRSSVSGVCFFRFRGILASHGVASSANAVLISPPPLALMHPCLQPWPECFSRTANPRRTLSGGGGWGYRSSERTHAGTTSCSRWGATSGLKMRTLGSRTLTPWWRQSTGRDALT